MAYWTNKVALITGGSAGLGQEIARALVAAGANVTITARDPARLKAAAEAVSTPENHCRFLAADLTRPEDVERLFLQLSSSSGGLDLLVNCAGRSTRGQLINTTAEQFQELLEVNFLSAVRCTHAALPQLLQSKGHLVNIGSLASKTASPYLGPYPASKFPLAAYSQQLRLELCGHGLHVLLVCPGPIQRDDQQPRYAEQSIGLPLGASKPGGGVQIKRIDPKWLAERILLACERRRAELVVPSRAVMLFALSQLWPRLGDWIITRMTKT